MTKEENWETKFNKRFIYMQRWTGGIGLSQAVTNSPSIKQDIPGILDFIQSTLDNSLREQREKILELIPDSVNGNEDDYGWVDLTDIKAKIKSLAGER